MRLRKALPIRLLVLMVCIAGAGCSSLMVPDYKKQRAEQVAPSYNVGDNANTKRRTSAEARVSMAGQRLQSGDLKAAESEARAAIKINPASVDAHTLLAVIYDRQGDKPRSGQHYKQAAELAPRQGAALNNYGAWLCANGFEAEALVWFDRALADPRYASPASALANAGGCALKVGQYERAQRDLRKALVLEPRNAYALAAMAESEFRQNRYFEARAFTERRLAAAPANPGVLQLAAEVEEKLGDRAAASRYVQRLRAEFPGAVTANPGGTTRP
jgi:type IV pilus assembly protein PilF